MTGFRLKQIGLALCLMASLLFGSALGRTCPPHEEAKASENDGYSHHELAEKTEVAETGIAVDSEIVCCVDRLSSYVASRWVSRELKSNDAVADSEQIVSIPEFVALTTFHFSSPEFTHDLSYSNTLKVLLPSRAPPRL